MWLKNLSGSVEQVAEWFELGVLSKWLKSFAGEHGASGCAVKFVVVGSKRLYAMSKRLYEKPNLGYSSGPSL